MAYEPEPGERLTESIRNEVIELSEKREQTYLSADRRDGIGREIGHLLFELRWRRGDFDRPQPTDAQLEEFQDATGYGVFQD